MSTWSDTATRASDPFGWILARFSAGPDPPKDIYAVIEIPLGGAPVKYELDKASGALMVDRFLHTAMFYPGNYGFIPQTLSADGDPCDVLVVTQVQVVPGAIVRAEKARAHRTKGHAGTHAANSRPSEGTVEKMTKIMSRLSRPMSASAAGQCHKDRKQE